MELRLGIYLFIFCKGRAEIANFSGDQVNGVSQRQLDPEGGSAPYLRLKFYLTVMQLHKPKRVGQSDAGTAGPRGEKQLKYFLLVLGRDAFPESATEITAVSLLRRRASVMRPPFGVNSEAFNKRLSTA